MNAILVILFIALLVNAVLLGASRSPKAKGIVNEAGTKKLLIYLAIIVALIIIAGIIKTNLQ